MQDYPTTFGRLFGDGGGSTSSSPTRTEFGVGFMRSAATYSPAQRTRCVQDIIMRDRTGAQADMPVPIRCTPTTRITNTTHQDLSPAQRASPRATRDILPLDRSGSPLPCWCRSYASPERASGVLPSERTSPHQSPVSTLRKVDRSPTKTRTDVGAIVFSAPPPSPRRSPLPRQSSPEGRRKFLGGRDAFAPTGRLEEGLLDAPLVRDGNVPTDGSHSDTLQKLVSADTAVDSGRILRQEEKDRVVAHIQRSCGNPGEWKYRAREVAKIRSQEHVRLRWR